MKTYMHDKIGELLVVGKVIVLYIATMFGYFSFDHLYLAIVQVIPISNFREVILDIKELVSLLFSLIVTTVAVFKLLKYIKEYKNDTNSKNRKRNN